MGKMGKIPKYKKKISGRKIKRMRCERRKVKRVKGNKGRVKRLQGCPFRRVKRNICVGELGLVRGVPACSSMGKIERMKKSLLTVLRAIKGLVKSLVHKTFKILRQESLDFKGSEIGKSLFT
jgi:hypothetical protein